VTPMIKTRLYKHTNDANDTWR